MSVKRTARPFRRPSLERCTRSDCESDCECEAVAETSPLLRKATPLPKMQVAALLLVFLPESVTSTLIYPFIVQVSALCVRAWTYADGVALQLVRNLNIVKGDPASVGYYSGIIVSALLIIPRLLVLPDTVGIVFLPNGSNIRVLLGPRIG